MQNIADAAEEIKQLYTLALSSRERAYVPYSQCKVGAAICTTSGKIFGGCNVENASYGASICAERTAIQKAVSELGKIQITKVLVVTDAESPWPPCGLCRQFICEFAIPETEIYLTNLSGKLEKKAFSELFPMGFSPGYLAPQE